MAELNGKIELEYAPPVVLTPMRYQDLLESETLVQMIAQARDDFDNLNFHRFIEALFPKVNTDGGEG